MCGIFGMFDCKDAARMNYLGLYALQHRGEESTGIAVTNTKTIKSSRAMGLVCDTFDEKTIRSLKGNTAVGHVRYSTTGSSNLRNTQPFVVHHKMGDIAIAHNGNLTNTYTLRGTMEANGSIFQSTMDSEIIAHLITCSRAKGHKSRVISAIQRLEGAFSLVLLVDGLMVGARDPHGFRPLCLGKLGGSYVLASETCALDLVKAAYVRDIEPGEVVFIGKNKFESVKPMRPAKKAMCIFELIYFSRPDSNIFGTNVYETRKRLGVNMAKESKIDCDLVMPVPDSGVYAAIGYAQESGLPFEMGMIRNHYVGRTFIQPSQNTRDFRVRVKLNPIKDSLKGKRVVVIEDSIVRGTTSKARVKTLREAGAKEIHMCVSCPPIISPCFYGIDFPTKKELIANNRSIEWIRDYIGLDSLHYLSLDGMLDAMELPREDFCTACFTGKYPTKLPAKITKSMLE